MRGTLKFGGLKGVYQRMHEEGYRRSAIAAKLGISSLDHEMEQGREGQNQ